MNETVDLPLPHMNWFSICDVSYGQAFTVGICITKAYEVVEQRCTLSAAANARWTTSNQKLLVLEPQWIKSAERAKRLLIPPVYPLRGDPCLRRATNSCNRCRASQTRLQTSEYGYPSDAASHARSHRLYRCVNLRICKYLLALPNPVPDRPHLVSDSPLLICLHI